MPVPAVRAAGCVLWRRPTGAGPGGSGATGVEVAVVHRPKYDDWSHPKGKLNAGEDPAAAAVREVREETGMECVLGAPLPVTRYLTETGGPKEVSYWTAEAVTGAFEPNDEIDLLHWLPPGQARDRLSHPADRDLLDRALATLTPRPA
ncbi:NUDIX hydrolase [Streptomyces sodiiphilus]|uniref:NUDIX hydrolase n=1 Tax=Streptomyces sodiiphilus TaxID=226217 RepID=UPI0031CF9196